MCTSRFAVHVGTAFFRKLVLRVWCFKVASKCPAHQEVRNIWKLLISLPAKKDCIQPIALSQN